jgi:choline dehydrogenase
VSFVKPTTEKIMLRALTLFVLRTIFSIVTLVVFGFIVGIQLNILYWPARRAIDDSVLPNNSEFDFIIVGGGSAGATLANRLSENPAFRVLLLESGPQDNNLLIKAPALFSKLFKTAFDWGFYTVPQTKHGEGRRHFWPRGRVLGGSSSLNANICMWGSKADYDAWDEVLGGNSGWSGSDVWPYFEKAKIPGTVPAKPHAISVILVDAIQKYLDIPVKKIFTEQEHKPCVGFNQKTVFNGVRASSAEMYLTPDVVQRKNLFIKTNAHVRNVVFADGYKSNNKRVEGVIVDFIRGKNTQTVTIKASHEVILSAGAVQTPQLLMLRYVFINCNIIFINNIVTTVVLVIQKN